MGFLAVLSTVCAMCTVVCVVGGWFAFTCARRAEHAEARLANTRSRIIACEHALEALSKSHRKLTGQVHRAKRHDGDDDFVAPAQPPLNGAGDDFGDIDPDLEATLRLQQAGPFRP